jgi:hypothetical protein
MVQRLQEQKGERILTRDRVCGENHGCKALAAQEMSSDGWLSRVSFASGPIRTTTLG